MKYIFSTKYYTYPEVEGLSSIESNYNTLSVLIIFVHSVFFIFRYTILVKNCATIREITTYTSRLLSFDSFFYNMVLIFAFL